MSPGLTVVDGSVSWVPGTIVDVSVGNLIRVLSTWGCSGSWEGVLFGPVVGLVPPTSRYPLAQGKYQDISLTIVQFPN